MHETFDEAFKEAMKMMPEELEKVPVDPFIQESFDVFDKMTEVAIKVDKESNQDAGISQ